MVLAFGWVSTLLASADVAMGTANAWWWVFIGSSAFANLMCVGTGVLAVWRFKAPERPIWQLAEQVGEARGYERGLRDAARGNVVPMPRRETTLN